MEKLKALYALVCGVVCGTIEKLFHSQNRLSWRRLAVMIIATAFFALTAKLTGDQWVFVAAMYLGGDSLEKAVKAFRKSV